MKQIPLIIPIDGALTSSYKMTFSNATYILNEGASITTDGPDALYYQDGVSNSHVIIKGHITGGTGNTDTGVNSNPSGCDVKITGTGAVEAGVGVELGFGNQQLSNHGAIDGSNFGVWLQSVQQTVTNFGHISGGTDGIEAGGLGDVSVVNQAAGSITSQGVAVQFNGSQNSTSTLTNLGLLKGAWAFFGSYGDDMVINHGQMKGSIYMGEGDDTFDDRGGKVDHDIYGQSGNDTLITDSANVHLQEDSNGGTDTVKSTVTYVLTANVENLVLLGKGGVDGTGTEDGNAVTGNQGNNKLMGLGGADTLDGGRGNDVLKGGSGSDTFVFATNGGQDTVLDFKSGTDHIDLTGQSVVSDFNDMINNHVTTLHGDLTIHMGADTLTLANTQVSDLHVNDFSF
jgi:Ca2+-binding RTX toxin-like protein